MQPLKLRVRVSHYPSLRYALLGFFALEVIVRTHNRFTLIRVLICTVITVRNSVTNFQFTDATIFVTQEAIFAMRRHNFTRLMRGVSSADIFGCFTLRIGYTNKSEL